MDTSPDVVVGVDFGTLSGRALVVRVSDGLEAGAATYEHPHGVPGRSLPDGAELPPDWALQVPDASQEVNRRPGGEQKVTPLLTRPRSRPSAGIGGRLVCPWRRAIPVRPVAAFLTQSRRPSPRLEARGST